MAEHLHSEKRVPLHLGYFMLLALGILSGLWLHGHPILTLVALIAVVPFSLVTYIPRRFLNDEARQIFHYLVASAAIAWGVYRFGQHPPLDVMLIEVFTILGLSFAFTSHQRGHSLMLMISVVLVFYGSVAPPRSLYVWLVPIALVLTLVLLYQSRVASISGQPETNTRGTLALWNLPWIIVHAIIVLLLWGALVVVFPTPDWQSAGVAPVSFRTRNHSILPPRFQTWFRTPHREPGQQGEDTMEGTAPSVIDKLAMTRVENAGGQGTFSPESGGSGQPGDDLVMRVRSPLKLYWLGQLYDQYDGLTWSQSKEMAKQHLSWRQLKRHKARAVKQTYVIEKWTTPSLYAAYLRASRITPQHNLTYSPGLRDDFASVELAFPETPQPVPFAYEVQSYLDFHVSTRRQSPLEGWYEKVLPEHYLQLPEEAMASRVRNLAKRVTAGKETDLDRALAIRDYLRENYEYELSTKLLPEGREPVDFFLFDLREGHCEYYAATMTVLARLNGLPARVCTGYSPGNYNVLTEMFEVYEYHAHAWAQVFIPGRGWLTMDATPEGSLPNQTRTSPPMIGELRDPFSDEWRIRTPELSNDVQAYVREQVAIAQQKEQQANAEANTDGKGDGQPGQGDKLGDALKKLFGGDAGDDGTSSDGGRVAASQTPLDAFTTNVKAFFSRVKQGAIAILQWLRDILISWSALSLLVGLLILRYVFPRLKAIWQRRRRLRHSERLFAEAERQRQDDPPASILAAYKAIRGLLDLAGLPKREANKDLLEYVQDDISPDLQDPASELFHLYIKLQYQPEHPSQRDAERACQRAGELRDVLLPRIEHPPASTP